MLAKSTKQKGNTMTRFRKSTAAAAAGLAALTLLAAPGFAAPNGSNMGTAAPTVQLAHMGQGPTSCPGIMGQGPGGAPGMIAPGQGYGPGYGTGPAMMSPGMMGHGMMGSGMSGPGMMGPGQGYGPGPGYGMGPGMMGPGMGDQGMMGPYSGRVVTPTKDLSAADVRHFFEHRLEMHGNKHLKIGEVKEADDDTIVADIVTQDGSLVQRLKVDRHTGQMQQAE